MKTTATLTTAAAAAAISALQPFSLSALSQSAPAQTPPNIVFLLADDEGWADLGCTGSKYYETPFADRFAAQGMRFTAAYTMPNCAPTRACLWTGKYSPRTGIYTVSSSNRGKSYDRKLIAPTNVTTLPLDIPTLPEIIKGSGYMVGMFGKWHLGADTAHAPAARGFDDSVWWNKGNHFKYTTVPEVPHPAGQWLGDFLTDQGIRFIRKAHEAQKPFVLMLTHHAVHRPLQSPEEDVALFKKKVGENGQDIPTYAGMVHRLDTDFGRVLKELDDLGIANNTLVIFTSDNGGLTVPHTTNNIPLRGGKGMHYEGGVRVPFLARWPGVIKPGTVNDTPIMLMDFIPTVLDIMQRQPAKPGTVLDGVSFLPLLKSQTTKEIENRTYYWHCPSYLEGAGKIKWRSTPGAMIRQGPWKLIENFEDNTIELYNLDKDLSETTDLSKKEPQIAADLLAKMHQWRADMHAPMPTPNPDYHNPALKGKKEKKEKLSDEDAAD